MSPAQAALLLLDGEIPDAKLVKRAAKRCRGVICADGGIRHAAALGLRPDFVVGDMDSLPKRLRLKGKPPTFWCDFDENRSDFEKALEFAMSLGCRRVYVAGALGGKTDHALVNLGLLQRYSDSLEVVMLDRGVARLLGPGEHKLGLSRGRFSLLAAPRAVVTLTGARYPLERFELVAGSRGLGNTVRGVPTLTVHEGRVWAMCDAPPATL